MHRPAVVMLISALSIAGMHLAIRGAESTVPWQLFMMASLTIAVPTAVLVNVIKRVSVSEILTGLKSPGLFLRAIVSVTGIVCLYTAQPRLTAAEMLAITNTYPIWIAITAGLLIWRIPRLRTRVSLSGLFSFEGLATLGIGLAGVAALLFEDLQVSQIGIPHVAAVCFSMLVAWAMLIVLILGRDVRAEVVLLHLCLSLLVGGPLAALIVVPGSRAALQTGLRAETWDFVWLAGYAAALSVLGQWLRAEALGMTRNPLISSVALSTTGFAVVLEGLYFGHWPSPLQGFGMALITMSSLVMLFSLAKITRP